MGERNCSCCFVKIQNSHLVMSFETNSADKVVHRDDIVKGEVI